MNRRSTTLLTLLLTATLCTWAHAPRGPLRPAPTPRHAWLWADHPAAPYVVTLGTAWKGRPLSFPLPKATDAEALTDPFGGGTQIVLHLENYEDDDWCYPVPGAHITSPYGWRGDRGHSGTDIKTFGEDRICAAFEGVVTMSESFAGYGNCIVIAHSNGLTTLYSHNLRNMVSQGEHVTAGQVISLIGRTGHATGDHLHFECRVEGRSFNSALVFNHETNMLCRHKLRLTKSGTATVVP